MNVIRFSWPAAGLLLLFVFKSQLAACPPQTTAVEIQAGLAEKEITPPAGYPMAGYYHERLAQGALDPLKARAVVLQQGEQSVAMVFCDLTGIATDLTHAVRREVEKATEISAEDVILSATHSHTAPDYYRDLYLYLQQDPELPSTEYPAHLIEQIVAAIVEAEQACESAEIHVGSQKQQVPVAFNRRFVMRDGTVKTWQKLKNPEVVKAAGPIDPEVGICLFKSQSSGQTRGVLSNFALHLDTVGGNHWSADYPYFIEQSIRESQNSDVISLFGLGCCGDINHVDPGRDERNKTDFIGNSLGSTVVAGLGDLSPITHPVLLHRSDVVHLPLRWVSSEQVKRSGQLMLTAKEGTKVDFFDLVTAYKTVILDQFQNPAADTSSNTAVSWGLSHQLAGCGSNLPVEVHSVTIGEEVALVFLPGEIFVDLGLAIKQASPFKQTYVIELSNAVETAYVPTRAAFAGGSYEVTNSTIQAGSGEQLVEATLSQLRLAAQQLAARREK